MSWEGADGEDSLKATLMCPAELQCQERWEGAAGLGCRVGGGADGRASGGILTANI